MPQPYRSRTYRNEFEKLRLENEALKKREEINERKIDALTRLANANEIEIKKLRNEVDRLNYETK